MAGAQIHVELEAREAEAALKALGALKGNPTPFLRAIGAGLASNTRDRFNAGRGPDGAAWAPLLPAYAALRGPGPILVRSGMSGGLQGSITFATGPNRVEVGSNRIYAAIHQFGGTIRPKSAGRLVFRLAGGVVFARQVTIPARPYLGFGEEDRTTVLDVAHAFLAAAAQGRTFT